MADKFNSLADLLVAALGNKLRPFETFGQLFTEDAQFTFPFAPEGTPSQLSGRSAIVDHLTRLGPLIDFGNFTLKAVYHQGDTTIFEASCKGQGTETGLAYDQDYISVITTRDGQIANYADYWNPLILIHALGGQQALRLAYAKAGHVS